MPEPDLKLHRAPRLDADSSDNGRMPWRYEDDNIIDLTPYIRAISSRWRTIAVWAVLAAIATAVVAGSVLPKWYRASAVIRPISTPAVESRISGMLGGLGGGLGGLSGLAASVGAGNSDAEEYIAILQGFQFNVSLAEHHHISGELLKPGLLGFLLTSKPKDTTWAVYRALGKRFDCEYSIKTGNITLYFQSKNRADAERILGYYIDDLHELLRTREVKSASAAIESLQDEARTTPDVVLRAELYDLVAKQIQRKKMAQVEADFAFRVLDPPAASDLPFKPRVLLDSMIAAFLVSLFAASILLLSHQEPGLHRAEPVLHTIATGEDVASAPNGALRK